MTRCDECGLLFEVDQPGCRGDTASPTADTHRVGGYVRRVRTGGAVMPTFKREMREAQTVHEDDVIEIADGVPLTVRTASHGTSSHFTIVGGGWFRCPTDFKLRVRTNERKGAAR